MGKEIIKYSFFISLFVLMTGCQTNQEKKNIEFNWMNNLPILCSYGDRKIVVTKELGFKYISYANKFSKNGILIPITECRIREKQNIQQI